MDHLQLVQSFTNLSSFCNHNLLNFTQHFTEDDNEILTLKIHEDVCARIFMTHKNSRTSTFIYFPS